MALRIDHFVTRFVEHPGYLATLTILGPGLMFFRLVYYFRDPRTQHTAITADNMTTIDVVLGLLMLTAFLIAALSAATIAARKKQFLLAVVLLIIWPLSFVYAWYFQLINKNTVP